MTRLSPIASGQQASIALSSITVDPKFNARQVYREIDSLAESIDERGLEQPLVVYQVPRDRKTYLQSGFRRFRALLKVQDKAKTKLEVPVILKHYASHDEAMLSALAVDTTGDPLRNYDIAVRAKYLYEHIGSKEKVSRALGINRLSAQHLLTALDRLCPEVLAFWSGCPSPEAEPPPYKLFNWSKQTPMIQKRMLDAFREGKHSFTDEKGEPIRDKKTGKRLDGKRPGRNEIGAHIILFKKKLDEDELSEVQVARYEGMVAALRYVSGDLQRLL